MKKPTAIDLFSGCGGLHVKADGEWSEVYYGPFAPVKAASRYSGRDNKQMIAISKLKALKSTLDTKGPEAAVKLAQQMPADVLATEPAVPED